MDTLSENDFLLWKKALMLLPVDTGKCMEWATGALREFFPFERLFMAYGIMVAGGVAVVHWQAYGHESRYLEQQALTFELEKRGALGWWLINRKPFVIDPDQPPPYATKFEIDEIRTFDLKNVAAHGILNLNSSAGTYFSFSGIAVPFSRWHFAALRVLTPVLNDLYLAQLAATSLIEDVHGLTLRQREIVRLVVAGLSDKVIAQKLGIAPQTVKNQLSIVYQSLNVQSRLQLIARFR